MQELTFAGNTLEAWITAASVGVALFVILLGLRSFATTRLARIAARTNTIADDIVCGLAGSTRRFFLLAVSIYAASLLLTVPDRPARMVWVGLVLAATVQAIVWGNRSINIWLERFSQRQAGEDRVSRATYQGVAFLLRLALLVIIVLAGLDNLGYNITTLVAGLGIGGVAVALAVQNILGDLFSSMSIVLDKPFVVGDFIASGEFMGNVERIGLKTTRVRSLTGEQIVFSNSDLLTSRVRNYQSLSNRRVVFGFGVAYETPLDKLQAIPGIVRGLIESHEKTRFDRAHFQRFGDSALQFEVVYFVLDPDYNLYMDIQQAVNLDLCRRFADLGIEFAYPTRSVLLRNTRPAVATHQPADNASNGGHGQP